MLSRLQALDRLGGMELCRRRKDDRLYPVESQALAKFRSGVGNSIFGAPLLVLISFLPAQVTHSTALIPADTIEFLLTKAAATGGTVLIPAASKTKMEKPTALIP